MDLARPWTTPGSRLADNTGFWIEQGGARLRICGVGDLWTDRQNLPGRAGRRDGARRRDPALPQP